MLQPVIFAVILSSSNVSLLHKYLLKKTTFYYDFNNVSTKWVLAGFCFHAVTAPEPCKIPLLFSNFGSLLSRNCQIADIPSSLDCVHKCAVQPLLAFCTTVLEGNSLPSFPLLDTVSVGITAGLKMPNASIHPLLWAGAMGAPRCLQDRLSHALPNQAASVVRGGSAANPYPNPGMQGKGGKG